MAAAEWNEHSFLVAQLLAAVLQDGLHHVLALPADVRRLVFARGDNRALGRSAELPSYDLAVIVEWLTQYRASRPTYRAYFREVHRWLLWCYLVRRKPVASLMPKDFKAYRTFLFNVPRSWCGPKRTGEDNWTDRRPFEGPLSATSCSYAFKVLARLYRHFGDIGYLKWQVLELRYAGLEFGPAKEDRLSGPRVRQLERQDIRYVVEYLHRYSTTTPDALRRRDDLFYLFALLYCLGPKLHELQRSRMSDFYEWHGQWWWRCDDSSSRRVRHIPVPADLVGILRRYRGRRGWRPEPGEAKDKERLLFTTMKNRAVTDRTLNRLIKELFNGAADQLDHDAAQARRKTAADHRAAAARLRAASPDWLRRTHALHAQEDRLEPLEPPLASDHGYRQSSVRKHDSDLKEHPERR